MVDSIPVPVHQLLWAKTCRDGVQTHPLICHMIDVAEVARALWDLSLTDGIRHQMAAALALDVAAACSLVAFWAGLHDLGKATPSFQRKHEPAVAELRGAGLDFPRLFSDEPFYHGTATARLLPPLLQSETGLAGRWAQPVGRALGGHHGAWPVPKQILDLSPSQVGRGAWDQARRELVGALCSVLGPSTPGSAAAREDHNAFMVLLSGLTSVADWIGSMERHFPYSTAPVDLAGYREQAKHRAECALSELEWTAWQPPADARDFGALFGLGDPRPVQAAAIDLAGRLDRPALVIVEAETGTGKTEAALYLADRWARVLQQRGLYVAMPTTATSDQMHGRVRRFLADRYAGSAVEPLLIHGQAQWAKGTSAPTVTMARDDGSGPAQEVEAMAWFLPRKRSLLAPFGVGTVDQALLSVLQTRHFFVRLLGLSHKTVVFDEVHAYDTYMSTLFQQLLSWLRALGTSVVVLSATLSARTREELLRAYAGASEGDLAPVPYPAITWAVEGTIGVLPVEPSDARDLALSWLPREPAAIADELRGLLAEGGCAAVICNTVARAQEVYGALGAAGLVADDDLILFHARFPAAWRRRIEDRVVRLFGKPGERPRASIVVATQVIEQSLDLDFDAMVTDLAPVDLLIQRAGRLHRHPGRQRPPLLSTPRLSICAPDLGGEVPGFGAARYPYEEYVLLRSYLALGSRRSLTLPEDTTPLIEAVYGPDEPDAGRLGPALAKAAARLDANQAEEQFQAKLRLIGGPHADNLLSQSVSGLSEDAPDLHRTLQALTRLGPPSLPVVCLHRLARRLNTEPDGSGLWVDLDRRPGTEETQALVGASVSVSHRGVFGWLVDRPVPSGWRDHPLLGSYRAAAFTDGRCDLPGCNHTLRLSKQLGLEIVRRSEEPVSAKEEL